MSTLMTREPALAAAFVDIADTMVVGYDVVDMAHRLAGHCVRLLDVAAAGLLLTDGQGNLGLLAASDERAQLMELFQVQADQEGPCLECFRTGAPVTAVNVLRSRERWPGFVAIAQEQGFQTVHALPMRLREQTIGTLNLFRTGVDPLSAQDLTLAQALADITTISILQERALARSEIVVEQLQGALNSRVIIEQAKGVLSIHGHMSTDQAFEALRGYARANSRRLAEVAREVVVDPGQAEEVAGSAKTTP